MNKDQIKGRAKEIVGNIKTAAGKLVGNKKLEEKGKIEKAVGTVQSAYGDLKNAVDKKS